MHCVELASWEAGVNMRDLELSSNLGKLVKGTALEEVDGYNNYNKYCTA